VIFHDISIILSGGTVIAADSPFGRLGLTVCYDLRFPEIYQCLRFKHQAQVIVYASALYIRFKMALY
jgi:predicted amidohydrolase